MKVDDEALRFVAEGLKSYREVSAAMSEFEKQTKFAMQQVLEEFADRFEAIGCRDDRPIPRRESQGHPCIEVQRARTGVWIGIGIRTKVDSIDVTAFVTFLSGAVREAVRAHLDKAALGDWRQNYESPRSYVWRSSSPDHTSQIFTILHEGLRTLLDALWQVPEFRAEFQLPNHSQN